MLICWCVCVSADLLAYLLVCVCVAGSVSMHPSGLYIVVSTANRMYFLGILRSELQSIAEFPLVGAGRALFNVDGGKFAVSTNKQVRRCGYCTHVAPPPPSRHVTLAVCPRYWFPARAPAIGDPPPLHLHTQHGFRWEQGWMNAQQDSALSRSTHASLDDPPSHPQSCVSFVALFRSMCTKPLVQLGPFCWECSLGTAAR